MPTNTFPEIQNAALQKLLAALFDSIRQPDGSIATVFKDRRGVTVPLNSNYSGGVANAASQASPGRGFKIEITVNPDGSSAWCRMVSESPAGAEAARGTLDTAVLSTKLV